MDSLSRGGCVVLVHGLFYGRTSMRLLARRLRRLGYRTALFGYRPTRDGPVRAAGALRQFVRACEAAGEIAEEPAAGRLGRTQDVLLQHLLPRRRSAPCARPKRQPGGSGEMHLVGHSLGGLVILRALADDRGLPPGRVLLLGSPLQGSRVARRVMRWRLGRTLLGAAGPDLAGGYDRLPARSVGMIAGRSWLGLGRLAGAGLGPSDGTVALDEADAPGLAGRLVLPVSHTGLLFSRDVAQQAAHFLHYGRFGGAGDPPA